MSLRRYRSLRREPSGLDLESVARYARYRPFAQHFRTDPEEADPVLDQRADGSLWAIRRRPAQGVIPRRADQLHDRFPLKALPDRGESASDRAYHFAHALKRTPLRQDSVSDARHFLF